MANFVKLTTRFENGIYLRQWVPSDAILLLKQLSNEQEANNEGICVFKDGTEINLIAFNETIDSLR